MLNKFKRSENNGINAVYADAAPSAADIPAETMGRARRAIYRRKLSSYDIDAIWQQDRAKERKRFITVCAAVAVLFVLCSMVRYNAYYFDEKFVPVKYVKSWALGIRLLIAKITGNYSEDAAQALIDGVGGSIIYLGAFARLKISLMSFVAGAGVSIAGAIFQTAYKNPMASPNIIGATAGVQLGNVIVVMVYSTAAVSQIVLRYKFCYGFTALCVLGVLLLGRLASDKRDNYSVMEMVMMGSIVSQVLGVVSMYIMYNLEDEDMLVYQQLTLGTYMETDNMNVIILLVVMAVLVLPVLIMRYRMNIIGLDLTETTSAGIDPKPLRTIAQVCGVLMVTSAMIHCGQVGMISMLIPYIVRKFIGSDFRYVCVYSGLFGGAVLLVCRMLTSFVLIAEEPLPVTFIVNILLIPVFMVVLARQRRDDI